MWQIRHLYSGRRILLRTILFSVACNTAIGGKDKENTEKGGDYTNRGAADSYYDTSQNFGDQSHYQRPHPNAWPQDQYNGGPNAAPGQWPGGFQADGFQRPGFQGNGVNNPPGYGIPRPPQYAYGDPQAVPVPVAGTYPDPRPNQGLPNNNVWPQTQQNAQTNTPSRINGRFGNLLASGAGGFVGAGLGTLAANAYNNNGLHGGHGPHLSGPHLTAPHLNAPQVGVPFFATKKQREKWEKKQKKMLKKQKKKFKKHGRSSSSSSSSSDSS